MKYSFTLAALAASAVTAYDYGYDSYGYELKFTSIYNITAYPDQVVSASGAPAPGQYGAKGQFNYAIDSKHDVICYDITLTGVTGDYQSPAKTATHIHEGCKGKAGPPRIALPNPGPVTDYGERRSVGCLKGPFTTGIKGPDNTTDTGYGFKLSQIEENPAGFFTDSHTVAYPAGVVRGQLDQDYKILKSDYPYDDGSVYTTATYTKTEEYTVTKCPAEKTYCPGESYPYVTKTEKVYTTYCPKSEVPYYPKETKTYYQKPHETPVYTPVYTNKPVYTKPVDTVIYKPVETKPAYPVDTIIHKPVQPSTTGAYVPVKTQAVQYTGAATDLKVGGVLMVAGLAAALL